MAPHTSRQPTITVLAIGLALLLAALVFEFLIWPDWDATWLIAIARKIRAGATLYSADLIEVNPPTIVEVARVALALADMTGVTAVTAWRWLIFVIECLTLVCSLILLRETRSGRDETFFVPAGVALVVALSCLPGINFGQREHVILLLTTPYVLAAAVRVDGGRVGSSLATACGVMLAVALSIKPHYLLIPLCVETCVGLLLRRVSACVRRETVSAVVSAIALAAVLLIRYPGYLTVAVPFAFRFYLDYVDLSLSASHAIYLGTASVAALGMWYWRINGGTVSILLASGVGAFLALLTQGKGWEYHFLPARSLLFLVIAFAVARSWQSRVAPWLQRQTARSAVQSTLVMTLVLAVGLGLLMARRARNINEGFWPRRFAELQEILERERPTGPLTMATLSLELFPAFPVVEVMGGTWASRYSCLWTVPAIEVQERAQASEASKSKARLVAEISEDLANFRPAVLLIESSRSRLLDDIVTAPSIASALKAYRLVGHVDMLGVWVRGAP